MSTNPTPSIGQLNIEIPQEEDCTGAPKNTLTFRAADQDLNGDGYNDVAVYESDSLNPFGKGSAYFSRRFLALSAFTRLKQCETVEGALKYARPQVGDTISLNELAYYDETGSKIAQAVTNNPNVDVFTYGAHPCYPYQSCMVLEQVDPFTDEPIYHDVLPVYGANGEEFRIGQDVNFAESKVKIMGFQFFMEREQTGSEGEFFVRHTKTMAVVDIGGSPTPVDLASIRNLRNI